MKNPTLDHKITSRMERKQQVDDIYLCLKVEFSIKDKAGVILKFSYCQQIP